MERDRQQEQTGSIQSNGSALETLQPKGFSLVPPVFQLRTSAQHAEEGEELETTETGMEGPTFSLGEPPADTPDPPAGNGNPNGLPFQLKENLEAMSGISMNDVTVHYQSSKPAQLKALAYAQGEEIHLGPGQEKHLPHEAWHVVQQKQGRVQPTLQMKGRYQINNDEHLEKEADAMGEKAATSKVQKGYTPPIQQKTSGIATAQLLSDQEEEALKSKMGIFKFNKAKEQGVLDYYHKLKDEELAEIKEMRRDAFVKSLRYVFLESDDDFQEAEPQSTLGWLLSKIGFGKEDEGDAEGPQSTLREGYSGEFSDRSQSMWPEDAQKLVEDKDEEEESDEPGDGLGKKVLELAELEIIGMKIPDGTEREFSSWGGKAEASGNIGAKVNSGGIEGEAKLELKLGKGGKKPFGIGSVGSDNTNITAGGTIEGHVGGKAGFEGKASFDRKKFEGKVKGKAGAHIGGTTEGSIQVMIKGGGMQIAKAEARGGLMLGVGGEFSYIYKWEGGELVIGSGGKAAVGLGVSWSYKMKLNTPGLMAKLGDYLSSWGSWGRKKIGL